MFVVEIINWIWFILFVCIRKRYWEMIGNHSAFATVEHTFLMQNLNQLGFFWVLHRFHSIYVLVLTHNNWRWTNKQRQSVRIYCDEASIRLCAWRFYVWHVIVIRRFDDSCVVLRWKHVRTRRIRTTDWWMDAEWSSVWQADRSRRINETAYADTRHTCGLPKRFIVVFMSNAIRWLANAVLWHAMDAAANAVRRQFRNYQQFDIVLC